MGTKPPAQIIERHQGHSISDDAGVRRKLHDMIRLDHAHNPIDRRVVATPGGFAWWYGEVLDEDQTGVVVIWSFGLPFLPGYMSKVRKGHAETPCERAAVNIVAYNRGVPDFYLLHEFRPGDVSWDGRGSWRFGNTHFESVDEGKSRRIDATIDIPLTGGGRLEGRIRFGGPVPRGTQGRGSSTHLWTPLIAPCFGTAMLREDASNYQMKVSGRGYVDRNASPQDLETLGIKRWFWAHALGRDTDRIAYALWPESGGPPECYGFEISQDGVVTTSQLELATRGEHKRPYGMQSFRAYEFKQHGLPFMKASLSDPVDDGPFYLRYLTRSEGYYGSAELIEPKRIDRGRHRALVRMRVQSDIRRNSVWLPLFQGARESHLRQLSRRFLPGRINRLLP